MSISVTTKPQGASYPEIAAPVGSLLKDTDQVSMSVTTKPQGAPFSETTAPVGSPLKDVGIR